MDKMQLAYDIYCTKGKIDFTMGSAVYRIQAEGSEVYLMRGEEILERLGNIQNAIQFLIKAKGVELILP